MATIILGVFIFGFSGYIVYTRYLSKNKKSSCDCPDCHCETKKTK